MGEMYMHGDAANEHARGIIAAQICLVKHVLPHLKKGKDGKYKDFHVRSWRTITIDRVAIEIYFQLCKKEGGTNWMRYVPQRSKNMTLLARSEPLERAVDEYIRRKRINLIAEDVSVNASVDKRGTSHG